MKKEIQTNESKKVDDSRAEVTTVLSLLERDSVVVSEVQKEVLKEEIEELPAIKEGDINVSGVYAYDQGDNIEVKVYIRNGLSHNVNFEHITFMIVNSKGEVLANQVFNLKELGEIPACSARPFKLYFDKKNVYVDEIPMDDWKIAFGQRVQIEEFITTEYENLPDEIGLDDKVVFDKFLADQPQLKAGEFSISTFSVGIQKDGTILVTVVMRNASDKSINIERVPVTVKDAAGNIVKSNLFEFDNFVVSPFKAKICNFAFPTGVQLQEDAPLNEWKVEFKLYKIDSENIEE